MAGQTVSAASAAARAQGDASASVGAGAYVLEQFREFYEQVMDLRDGVLRGAMPDDPAPAADAPDTDAPPLPPSAPPLPGLGGLAGPPLPAQPPVPGEADDMDSPNATASDSGGLKQEAVIQRLQTLLEMQALEAGRRGGEYGVFYYKEAEYVMAALADEVFLTLDWPGRDAWRNDLLETRLFGTYNAGDVFYQRLEKILKTGDRIQAEIAIVYLVALTLGFRGRYGDGRSEDRVAEYRRRLYYYVYQHRPDLADPSHRLTAQAYRHTGTDTTARMLPSPARWLWLLAVVVALYMVASHFIFVETLAPLLRALEGFG